MTVEIIIQIILFGIALAMDAFAVSVTDGLIYSDINKKRSIFIASTFGIMQGLMPLVGYYIIELTRFVVGESGGSRAAQILSVVVSWLSFGLLIFIGSKMLIEGIRDVRNSDKEKEAKKFSIKEVLIMGVATAIDAMAVGVSLNAGLSTNSTIWLHIAIIAVITFVICLIGLFLGKFIVRLFKGKYEITVIIGGVILILLAIWVIVSHCTGL
jgi:putative Mn2+ efflux pump MntP